MTELPKISVYAYDDYRVLLNDLFIREKNINPNFSYEYAARKIGVTKSYLKLIFQKKNHSSIDKLSRISNMFRLSSREFQYLLFLYLKESANESLPIQYFSEILTNIKNQEKVRAITPDSSPRISSPILTNWFIRILCCLSDVPGFKSEKKWIEKRIINLKENDKLEKALQVFNDENLQFKKPLPKLKLSETEKDEIYKSYFLQACNVLENKSAHDPSHFHSICVSVDEKSAMEIIQIYQEAKAKALEVSKKIKSPDTVLFVLNGAFKVASEEELQVN